MKDLEAEISRRFLDQLDRPNWYPSDPHLDFGLRVLPYFVAAFKKESDPNRRALLVEIIWEFRDASAFPALSIALDDAFPTVWQAALDGIVTIGEKHEEAALQILQKARESAASDPEKISWIDEAIDQVLHGSLDERGEDTRD